MRWPEDIPWPISETPSEPALEGEVAVDVAIVGGGLAGLCTALRLMDRDPALRVALLEAGRIGCGASGRNTGMIGPGVGGTITALRRKRGDAEAARIFGASQEAVRCAIALIEDEGLDCDLEVTGQLKVAVGARQGAALRRQARDFAALGFEVPWVGPEALKRRLGVGDYHGGLWFPQAAIVNPARWCKALQTRLKARGVRIFERTPAVSIEPGAPAQVVCSKGRVRAKAVVVAAGGWTARLGVLRGQVVPLHTHVLATDPLSPDTIAALGWPGREAIIDGRRFFNFYRLTRDGRLIFGGGRALYRADRRDRGAGQTTAADPAAWRRLIRELRALSPALADTPVAKAWSGVMGFTLDGFPVTGPLRAAPGVFAATGWCGHGLAMATAGGAKVADAIVDGGIEDLAPWGRGRAPQLPPDPLRSAGLSIYLAALDATDHWEVSR